MKYYKYLDIDKIYNRKPNILEESKFWMSNYKNLNLYIISILNKRNLVIKSLFSSNKLTYYINTIFVFFL